MRIELCKSICPQHLGFKTGIKRTPRMQRSNKNTYEHPMLAPKNILTVLLSINTRYFGSVPIIEMHFRRTYTRYMSAMSNPEGGLCIENTGCGDCRIRDNARCTSNTLFYSVRAQIFPAYQTLPKHSHPGSSNTPCRAHDAYTVWPWTTSSIAVV